MSLVTLEPLFLNSPLPPLVPSQFAAHARWHAYGYRGEALWQYAQCNLPPQQSTLTHKTVISRSILPSLLSASKYTSDLLEIGLVDLNFPLDLVHFYTSFGTVTYLREVKVVWRTLIIDV